jgi:hypothetical protein
VIDKSGSGVRSPEFLIFFSLYGFSLRKDFPFLGYIELRYDTLKTKNNSKTIKVSLRVSFL